VDSSPVIAGDKVVAGSFDGRLYIVNLSDGKLVWSYEIGSAIVGCPAVSDGKIIIGAEDGRVYAFGPNPLPVMRTR
jgi:outer membrane protein assembly factor BamB